MNCKLQITILTENDRTDDDENDYGYPEYREKNDKEIAQLKRERD